MRIKNILLIGNLCMGSVLYAQENNTSVFPVVEKSAIDSVMTYVAEWPEYKGGQKAMYAFLGKNLHYPRDAEKLGVEGRVIVGFTVSKTGDIKDVYLVKSVYPSLDDEAIRVVELMPRWMPGRNNGDPVNVKFKIDIVYKIPEKDNNKQDK